MLWRFISGTPNTGSDCLKTFHSEQMIPGLNCLWRMCKDQKEYLPPAPAWHQTPDRPCTEGQLSWTEKVFPKRPKRKSAADLISPREPVITPSSISLLKRGVFERRSAVKEQGLDHKRDLLWIVHVPGAGEPVVTPRVIEKAIRMGRGIRNNQSEAKLPTNNDQGQWKGQRLRTESFFLRGFI